MKNLRINEIFYSLQGEGGRTGQPSIFIRLADCNMHCSFCDTNFEEKMRLSFSELLSIVDEFRCEWIIWTGGEPCLQLTDEWVSNFSSAGYLQAIETNGTLKPPRGLDYITCSPKVNVATLRKTFAGIDCIDEFRYLVEDIVDVPSVIDLPKSRSYYLSPVFNDGKISESALLNCINFIKENPEWRLSAQMHKIWGIL